VLCSHPIQYYAPLYRSLAKRGNIRVKVVFLSDAGAADHFDKGFGRNVMWDVPLLEGYDHVTLQPGSEITARGFWRRYDGKLPAVLNEIRPDWILLYGYASRMNWAAKHWAGRHGARLAYWSDSNIRDPRPRSGAVVKRLLLSRLFFRRLDAVLVTSEANRQYVLRYGAIWSQLHRVPFSIDVNRFQRPATSPLGDRRDYDFVWAGKLIPLKRSHDYLAALDLLAQRSTVRPRALMIGDGPLRSEILAASAALRAGGTLEYPGFVNQRRMPAALQNADTLVFTSEIEAFGLAALEAAAAGLALVVADNIGCVGPQDVAREGVNALTFKARDVAGLAMAMERVLTAPSLRLAMQQRSAEIAQQYDTERAAAAIESVVLS
jgi:glycosyltransferase involved in cell wall biosynthesis